MENEKINILREELNKLIDMGADFEEIQKVSHRLDKCLVEYYNNKLQTK